MAIIEQIVSYRQLQQQEKEQDDDYRLEFSELCIVRTYSGSVLSVLRSRKSLV